jgi:hypothetical protein
MKMEPIQCSETSAYKIQTPGNYPEDNILQLDFYLNSKGYKSNADIPGELLACNLDIAERIKNREDQLRRRTRDLRTRVAKCTEVVDGIFESLL